MWITDIIVRCIPDPVYLKIMYRIVTGKKLDLKNPKTFNEKLQWLKLHDRNPEYTKMVDKYEVRQYIKDTIGEEYLIPLVGGPWERFEDIDFSKLPEQFVLKCTHDSGSVAICRDKTQFDIDSVRKKFNKALKGNFFYGGREWPYKNVKPRIIAEKYMVDESGSELKDYKIFNFNGKTKIIEVDYDRFVEHKRNLYTTDWKYIEAAIQYPTDPEYKINKPRQLEKMIGLAERLSKGIPHVRTDFYSIDDQILFGEMTFYHEGGFGKFAPVEWDETFGEWIKIRGGGILKTENIRILIRMEKEPKDYKIFNFDGEPKVIQVDFDRFENHRHNYYSPSWDFMDVYINHSNNPDVVIEQPHKLSELLRLAKKLSQGIPHIRTDFYLVGEHIYFGELTFFHESGFGRFTPMEFGEQMGDWIKLPGKKERVL